MATNEQHQSVGGIIKTTARFQETQEPLRQKPIIQIDPAAPLQQYENLARSSIDSGRDNPFKPDGKIYKSADPIVDYYKFGPHQSRTQSPTDSRLLIGGDHDDDDDAGHDIHEGNSLCATGVDAKDGNKQKKTKKRRKKAKGLKDASGTNREKRKPCWRRWICCCCCCLEDADGNCCCCNKGAGNAHQPDEDRFDASQYESPPSVDSKTKHFKRSKIVALQGDGNSTTDSQCRSDQSILHSNEQTNGTSPDERVLAVGQTEVATSTKPISANETPTPKSSLMASDQKLAPPQLGTQTKAKKQQSTEPKRTPKSRCAIS